MESSASPTSDHKQERGGRALGRYVLYDAIARGGMATVHFGRLSGAVGFSRTVAIKRLHPHLATDPEFVAMLLDEARLAARIRHPNVVPTLDVVADSGEVFIVMEYVQGESLARLWRAVRSQNERIPLRYSLAAIAGALHGLHAAHEVTDESGAPLGIVHRDVSPQNILLGTDGVSRVLDFGVAKAAGRMAETGDSGSLKGKIAYMAPEHISGSGVTRRTDVYAASVVLWEILTGERLFDGENDAQRAAKILNAAERQNAARDEGATVTDAIPRPSRYNPEVSSALDDIVMRGLSWPPETRFETAKEMASALEQNGGLVPATELGEWVARLASVALAERAGRLNAIEASGKGIKPVPMMMSLGGMVADADADATATAVADPPVFVEQEIQERPKSRTALLILGLGVLGIAVAGVVWRVGRVHDDPAALQRDLDGTNTVASALATGASSSVATATSTTATGSIGVTPTASTTTAAAAIAPISSNKATIPRTGAGTGTPRISASAKVIAKDTDCDPPYTIDAENHKIYKRNCMK